MQSAMYEVDYLCNNTLYQTADAFSGDSMLSPPHLSGDVRGHTLCSKSAHSCMNW